MPTLPFEDECDVVAWSGMIGKGEEEALTHKHLTRKGKPYPASVMLGCKERNEYISCYIVRDHMSVVAYQQR